jgi:LmbE family N-acetylglucosaminyl deacetylase
VIRWASRRLDARRVMLPLAPRSLDGRGYELLCLGAHSDDIEMGCGGTLLRLLREWPVDRVTWVVLSGNAERAAEAKDSARRLVGRRPKLRILQAEFRESYFPYTAVPIKELFDRLRREVDPDLVLTHYRDDRHQDHRLVSELTYNTFRDHLVLEYEIIKLDGDIGNPNVYVPLDTRTARRKVDHLMRAFGSQRDKRWFTDDVFLGMMRIRGVEAGGPSGYAEAFYGRKVVL